MAGYTTTARIILFQNHFIFPYQKILQG